jgi:hypothetical protein
MSTVNLILNRYSVHVPSIARARIMPTVFLRRPLIYIDCHNGRDMEIKYPIGAWDDAKKDYETLQTEMTRVQKVLASIPVNDSPDSDSDSLK